MNERERYLFDLQGFVLIPGLLTWQENEHLLAAAKALETHAGASLGADDDGDFHQDPEFGYYLRGRQERGETLTIEDFWLFPDAFDILIGHPATIACVERTVRGTIGVNHSELRVRYPGASASMLMGYPDNQSARHAYRVVANEIDCMSVRAVYFLHDIPLRQGPLCFVPGSHKGCFPPPEETRAEPVDEAGVAGIPVKAGDAIVYTEACRQGALPNLTDDPQYTIHVGYGPHFLPSQNLATLDRPPYTTPELLTRLSEDQRRLLERP